MYYKESIEQRFTDIFKAGKKEDDISKYLRFYTHRNDEGYEIVGIPKISRGEFSGWHLYVNNKDGNLEIIDTNRVGSILMVSPDYEEFNLSTEPVIKIEVIPTHRETRVEKGQS